MGDWQNPYKSQIETRGHPKLINDPNKGWTSDILTQIQTGAGRLNKTYLEFGSGSGQHILAQAAKNPDTFYIGVELRYKRCLKAAEKTGNESLENILFFRGDGLSLMHCLEPESLDGIFILFPDPWEKRKWQKNRIMQEKNLALFSRILKPGGTVHYRTDHREYFESAAVLFEDTSEWKVNYLTHDILESDYRELTLPSEFELLFRSQNKPIYAIEVTKG